MLLSFYQRFVEPIQIGSKVHTMRDAPKRDPRIGETLHMYTGGYQAKRTLISKKEKLISKQRALIRISITKKSSDLFIVIDGRSLQWEEVTQFVKFDGFRNVDEFIRYWTNDMKKKHIRKKQVLFHWTSLRY